MAALLRHHRRTLRDSLGGARRAAGDLGEGTDGLAWVDAGFRSGAAGFDRHVGFLLLQVLLDHRHLGLFLSRDLAGDGVVVRHHVVGQAQIAGKGAQDSRATNLADQLGVQWVGGDLQEL